MKLAFVGFKGSGKSTFARMLSDNVYSFATPLKEASKVLFGLDDVQSRESKEKEVAIPERLDGDRVLDSALIFFGISEDDFDNDVELPLYNATAKELVDRYWAKVLFLFGGKTITVRNILQYMGTEVGRNTFGRNMWVNNMLTRIDGKDEVVIDDCRFLNESRSLKNEGFTIIGIDRPGLEVDTHPSETQMMQYWDTMVDLTVTNDGTIQETFRNIQKHLE